MQKSELSETATTMTQEDMKYINKKILSATNTLLHVIEHDCDSSPHSVFSSDWEYLQNSLVCSLYDLEALLKFANSKLEAANAKTGT